MVTVLGSNDRNDVDSVLARSFSCCHIAHGGVDPIRTYTELPCGLTGPFCRPGEHSGDELVAVVHAYRESVRGRNSCAGPTSDHSDAHPTSLAHLALTPSALIAS
jgi:hypothetical protein